MKIAISMESASDVGKQLIKERDIKVIPFEIVLKDRNVLDGNISVEELLNYVEETGLLPKTNALNEYEYTEYFESLRKDYDAVIHFCLSSGLSSSCANAQRASKNLKDVYVIDSKNLSSGIGLLVLYAKDLADDGYSPKDICDMVEKRIDKVQASFVVERLDFLYKGGRCNSLALLGANLLKIRPRIVVKDGKMSSDKKYRGNMEKVITKYCEDVLTEFNTPDLKRAYVTYSTATPEMISSAMTALKSAGFENIYEVKTGCTITSHCGGNTLGILYINDGE